jgi:hypothetical protein
MIRLLLDIDLLHSITVVHPANFDPEDGGSMYLRNIGNITHLHMVQRLKRKWT